jgi:hypothetical protein
MSENKDKQPSEADAELEREIRKERKFTLAESIGRMAGPGAMKGVSPVTRKQQAAVEIENWLRHSLSAGNGELQVVLLRRIKESELLLESFDQPLVVLTAFCQQVLDSDYLLKELVREDWILTCRTPTQTIKAVRKTCAELAPEVSWLSPLVALPSYPRSSPEPWHFSWLVCSSSQVVSWRCWRHFKPKTSLGDDHPT